MPWPVDDLVTDALDAGTDRPPRAEFLKLFQRVKTVIAGRGTASGIAALDTRRRVPDSQLGRGVAGGVASLDATGRLPTGQLPILPDPPQQVPPGTVIIHAGGRPPGWLTCIGSAVSRTTYAALFAAIGTTYGAGDGTTTFNLPDLRGRFPRGITSSVALGDTGGEGGAHAHRGRAAGAPASPSEPRPARAIARQARPRAPQTPPSTPSPRRPAPASPTTTCPPISI